MLSKRQLEKLNLGQYIPYMSGVASRIVGESDVDDVVQEALFKAISALPEFRWDSSLKTWLVRITVNEALTLLREIRRRNFVSLDEEPEMEYRFPHSLSKLPNQEEVITDSEASHRFESYVQKLSPYRSQLMCLYYQEGYSVKELSDKLGLTEAHTKSLLFRSRTRLKPIIQRAKLKAMKKGAGA